MFKRGIIAALAMLLIAAAPIPSSLPTHYRTEHSNKKPNDAHAENNNPQISMPSVTGASRDIDKASADAASRAAYEAGKHDGDGAIKWTDVAIVVLTGGLAFAAFLQFGAALLQWDAMRRQERQMRRSIIEGRRAANRQSRDIRQQIALARDEFVATHRPRVRLQKVANWDFGEKDGPASVEIVIANAGESYAIIHSWRAVLYINRHENSFWPDLNEIVERTPIEFVLGAGKFKTVIAKQRTVYWSSGDLMAGEAEMYLVGDISYEGADGIIRSTGFARKFAKGHWKPMNDSEYEYAY